MSALTGPGAGGGVGFRHDLAVVESSSVGPGTRVWAFAHVCAGAVVGRHAKVDGVSVLGDGAEIAPGTHVSGVRIPPEA